MERKEELKSKSTKKKIVIYYIYISIIAFGYSYKTFTIMAIKKKLPIFI